MRISAERDEVQDSFFPLLFFYVPLPPPPTSTPAPWRPQVQPQSSKHAAGSPPASFPGCRKGVEEGTQGQGREGGRPCSPLCTGRLPPTARPISAHRACAKSSDPWPGILYFRSCWKLPVASSLKPPTRGADLTALVTFVLAPGATQGPSPKPLTFEDISQMGS